MKWNDLSDKQKKAATTLWNYHHIHRPYPKKIDLMLVTGSHDLRVADRASDLLKEIDALLVVVTGGLGKITKNIGFDSEAERFVFRMTELGVDEKRLIVEPKASNSGENFTFSREIVDNLGDTVESGLIVTKPYMERRMIATGEKQWSEIKWFVDSPRIAIEEYSSDETPLERMINLMVGDLQRLKIYADKGFSMPQRIPDDVADSFNLLVASGFDEQII